MFSIIKRIIKSCAVLAVIVSFFCVVQAVDAATLSLNPSTSTVTLGDEFDMVVRIDTQGEHVVSADVVLTYDRNLLQVVRVSKGLSGGNSFFPDFIQSLSTGQIYMGGTVSTPTSTRIGEGVFSTVRFKAFYNGEGKGEANVRFVCQQGATNETNITRADKNATDIVSCSHLRNIYYKISDSPPSVESIQINQERQIGALNYALKLGKGSVGISALAYDQYSLPIWSGVTYEWGMSSLNTTGTLNPTNGNLTNFMPLNAGVGDLFVTARLGSQNFTASKEITVIAEKLGDLNDDNQVNLSDLSTLLSNFGKTNRSKDQGDINGNGSVTLTDLSTLLSNFGK